MESQGQCPPLPRGQQKPLVTTQQVLISRTAVSSRK